MSLKMQLTKGPTIVPAIFPFPDQFGQPVLVGFAGLSEIDFLATHILNGLLSNPNANEHSDTVLIERAVGMALRLQHTCNEINNRANQPQEEQAPTKPIILES